MIKSKRDQLYDYLKTKGIETMKNEYPFLQEKLPKTKEYEETTLRLPINPELFNEEIKYVIEMIKEFYEK